MHMHLRLALREGLLRLLVQVLLRLLRKCILILLLGLLVGRRRPKRWLLLLLLLLLLKHEEGLLGEGQGMEHEGMVLVMWSHCNGGGGRRGGRIELWRGQGNASDSEGLRKRRVLVDWRPLCDGVRLG